MIDIDRYRRIDEIFQAALELEPHQRASYISQACSGDLALLNEVEDLLASDGQQWELIGTPAFEMVAPLLAKEQPELQAGDSIGHYQVVSLLGVGGMGQVYLAEDAKLGRKVALKLLPPSYTRDDSRLRRFQQEARAASALNHPNILTIHELGEVNGEQFIATEFVEGETLRERLKRAPLSLAETLDVALQIAGALAAAHKAGIVHRDIKPENIMLRHDGYVKVLDFGLAKLTEQPEPATQTRATENVDISSGLVMGTVKYMSPEQARGQQVDPRSDIFTFGVVLYEMIAGRPPFEDKNSNELISAILKEDPSPLTDVPEETQRLVSRALRKKKEDRYQTIEDVLADLKSLTEDKTFTKVRPQHQRGRSRGSAISTREVSPISTATNIEYVISEIKRHKTATAVALVTVVILAGVALSYRYFFSPRSIKSIAVMPIVNQNGDPDVEYLTGGMTEHLIASLLKIPDLDVKPSSTMARYKGSDLDAARIGKELNVQAVFSSRFVQRGEDLTLLVELVDTATGNSLWQQTYNRKMSQLSALQRDMLSDVVRELRIDLSNPTRQNLARDYTDNAKATRLYYQGLFLIRRITVQEVRQGIDYLWKAIEHDPTYAPAYAMIASAHHSLTLCCDVHPTELVEARRAAQRALDIDPNLAEAHSALASSLYLYYWDFAQAEAHYLRALELNPKSATSHNYYGDFLGRMGRLEEAAAERKRALEIEPLSPFFNAFALYQADPNTAVERAQFVIDLDPSFYYSHVAAGGVYHRMKMYPEAIAAYQRAKELAPENTWTDVNLSRVFAEMGDIKQVRAVLDKLLRRSESRYVPPFHLALVYLQSGDVEGGLASLEKAYQVHDPKMTFIKTIPFKKLQAEPRFQDLYRRVFGS